MYLNCLRAYGCGDGSWPEASEPAAHSSADVEAAKHQTAGVADAGRLRVRRTLATLVGNASVPPCWSARDSILMSMDGYQPYGLVQLAILLNEHLQYL